VEAAIREVGGILATLTQEKRFAVLKRLNGAFGYKPKAPASSPKDQATQDKKPSEKSTFNADFAETFEGALLEVTSKSMRKCASSSKTKPGEEAYELHKFLLAQRKDAKSGKTKLVKMDNSKGIKPKEVATKLLGGYRAIRAESKKANVEVTPAAIFAAGACLLQGKVPANLPLAIGNIPNHEAWPQVAFTVPRTDDEAKERTAAIVASRKLRKQKRKKASEDQKPIAKRARANSKPAEADSPDDSSKDEDDMGMAE
jgi:hypothetical protein